MKNIAVGSKMKTAVRKAYHTQWSYVQGSKGDTDVKDRLWDSAGDSEGGMI